MKPIEVKTPPGREWDFHFASIDPDLDAPGIAWWYKGRLIAAGTSQAAHGVLVDAVVMEQMVYMPRVRKSVPEDLINVGTAGAYVAGQISKSGAILRLAKPIHWKGNVPKDVHHKRIRKYMTLDELAVMEDAVARAPNACALEIRDAVALGLWVLGRTGKGGKRVE